MLLAHLRLPLHLARLRLHLLAQLLLQLLVQLPLPLLFRLPALLVALLVVLPVAVVVLLVVVVVVPLAVLVDLLAVPLVAFLVLLVLLVLPVLLVLKVLKALPVLLGPLSLLIPRSISSHLLTTKVWIGNTIALILALLMPPSFATPRLVSPGLSLVQKHLVTSIMVSLSTSTWSSRTIFSTPFEPNVSTSIRFP